jgi:hypothetical protein
MGVIQGNVFRNSYPDLVKLDDDLIPTNLKPLLNSTKLMETELIKVENIRFRNSIIGFAEKMKVAMNFRSNNKTGGGSKIPWKCNVVAKGINFNGMADLFYFMSYPMSKFGRVLTAAVNINRSLKLQMQYADNNRFYCPKYKLETANGKYIPFFNQIITAPGHRQTTLVKNNVVRMLLSGPEGLQKSAYNVKYQPGCRWWGMLPLPHDT